VSGGEDGRKACDRRAAFGNELSALNILHDRASHCRTESTALYRSSFHMYRSKFYFEPVRSNSIDHRDRSQVGF
jgi:hypothetical protein